VLHATAMMHRAGMWAGRVNPKQTETAPHLLLH
jgi:hypothetical protein